MPLDEILAARREKLEKLKKSGAEPYPAKSWRTHTIGGVLEDFDALLEDKKLLVLAGRILAVRGHGGSTFIDIDDGTASTTIQAFFKKDVIGAREYDLFAETIDIGDFVEVSGTLFLTKKNERTVQVEKYRLLTKSLRPLPEKWHGLQDVEERLRHRYVDLIMDPATREMFRKKSRFWQSMREFLLKEGGLEVETPILERIPGGADAEPFKTHMNALDIDLYLRIAPELNLKRLITGGYDKVFEIGRIFRNEGIDKEHLQDYTQMEMYWAYTDYEALMKIIERLVKHVLQETLGKLSHTYQNQTIDWSQPWKRIDYYTAFQENTGLNLETVSGEELSAYAKKQGIDTSEHTGRGRLIDIIFKKKVRPKLIEPGFLILPPVDVEPLAKRSANDPDRVERFQIVAGGSELGKGFSELNDPLDQKNRLEEQTKFGEAGDKEAQRMDEDFVEALEYGMPPTAGFGLSERLFAFFVDKPIREIVFFPIMRPK